MADNYETRTVKLWIDNEEGQYNYWREVTQESVEQASEDPPFSRKERATLDLSDRLKDEHEEMAGEAFSGCGVFVDLLRGAMSEVNWYSIAEDLIEEHVDEEAA